MENYTVNILDQYSTFRNISRADKHLKCLSTRFSKKYMILDTLIVLHLAKKKRNGTTYLKFVLHVLYLLK